MNQELFNVEMKKLKELSAEMFAAMDRHDLDEFERIDRLREKQLRVCEAAAGLNVKRGKLDYSRFEA